MPNKGTQFSLRLCKTIFKACWLQKYPGKDKDINMCESNYSFEFYSYDAAYKFLKRIRIYFHGHHFYSSIHTRLEQQTGRTRWSVILEYRE